MAADDDGWGDSRAGGSQPKIDPGTRPGAPVSNTGAGLVSSSQGSKDDRALLVCAVGNRVYRIALEKDVSVVGRALDCDVKLDVISVSRRHCQIVLSRSGKHTIEDLKSSQGTFIADPQHAEALSSQRVAGQVALHANALLRIGELNFAFVIPTPMASPATYVLEPGGGQNPLDIEGDSFSIGREGCDLTLNNAQVSKRHALIEAYGPDTIYLFDLGSANGTFVNGERLKMPKRLVSGDMIAFGSITMRFKNGQDANSTRMGTVDNLSAARARESSSTAVVSAAELERARAEAMAASAPAAAASQARPEAKAPSVGGARIKGAINGAVQRLKARDLRFTLRFGGGILAVLTLLFPYPLFIAGECRVTPGKVDRVRPALSGQIEKVLISEGQDVKSGDPVVQLSDRLLVFDRKRAELALAQTKNAQEIMMKGPTKEVLEMANERKRTAGMTLSFAKKTFDRNKQLSKEGIVSAQSLQNSQEQLVAASQAVREAERNLEMLSAKPTPERIKMQQADVERAEKDLSLIDEQIKGLTLRSQIDGRVATPNVASLQARFVAAGQEVIEIQNTDSVLIELLIPESEIADVRLDQPVAVKIRTNPGEVFEGKVDQITPVAEQGALGSRVVVKARVQNDDHRLIPGTTGTGKIRAERRLVISQILRRLLRVFRID